MRPRWHRSAASRSAKVAPPIRLTVTRNAPLRPSRSPTTPKMIAPNGRKAKPAANSPSAAISAAVGSSPAKNTLEIVWASAAEDEEVVPFERGARRRAAITRVIDQGLWCCCSAILAIMLPLRQGIAQRPSRATQSEATSPSQDGGGGLLDRAGDEDRGAADDADLGLAVFVRAQPGDVAGDDQLVAAARYSSIRISWVYLLASSV